MRASSFFHLSPWLVLAVVAGVGAPACRDSGTPTTTSTSAGGGEDGEGGGGDGGATGSTSSGQGAGTPLVVVNWNVRNFFDTTKDTDDEGELVPSAAEYEEKIEAIATVLRELNPDVAVLQEVENQTILLDLANRISPDYIESELVEGNDYRGIDVGAISKIPFDLVVSHKDDSFSLPGGAPKTFTRDCPEFHLTFAGRKMIFLGVHFRSKGGDDDPDRRLAEAIRAREIADGLAAADPEAGIFVLGDFNDLPGSNPVEAVRGGNPPFLDAVDAVPEADRWTFDFQGALELIDHQMSNPVAAAFFDPTTAIIRHDAAASAASDHAPFSATYMVR